MTMRWRTSERFAMRYLENRTLSLKSIGFPKVVVVLTNDILSRLQNIFLSILKLKTLPFLAKKRQKLAPTNIS